MQVKNIVVLILTILLLIILFQNLAAVSVQIFFWSLHISFLLLMIIIFAIGIIVGWLLGSNFRKGKKSDETRA